MCRIHGAIVAAIVAAVVAATAAAIVTPCIHRAVMIVGLDRTYHAHQFIFSFTFYLFVHSVL